MSKVIIILNGTETSVQAGLVKVADFYEKLALELGEKWLYLGQEDDIDIPLLPEDHLVLHGGERIFAGEIAPHIGENPPVRQAIRPEFNGRRLAEGLAKAKLLARELKGMDAEVQPNRLFVDLEGQVDDFVAENLTIVVQDADSYFTIPAGEDEAIDLEACSRADRKPPKGQSEYKIKIDGNKYTVAKQIVTGEEILALAEKGYSEWTLNQKLRGGRRKAIEKEESVDLAQPGVERFETVQKQAQQGDEYPLPQEDSEFLNENGHTWKREIEGDKRGLIISNYRLPSGYAPGEVTMMLLIPSDYPTAGVDMFYFSPGASREDGVAIGALSEETHFGMQWQRWSRHYEWRPGEHNLAYHITYVANELKSELNRKP